MRVLIGTPVGTREVTTTYAGALCALLSTAYVKRPDIKLSQPVFVSSGLVMLNRNALASRVLEDPTLTHLLMIDSDLGFSPDAVFKMIDFDKPLVGCLYPNRAFELGKPPQFLGGEALVRGPEGLILKDGFALTRRLPTGLVLIRRDVLERLWEAHPELRGQPDEFYRRNGVSARVLQCFERLRHEPTGLYLGEDYAFSQRWLDLGGELWALVDEPVTHVGGVNIHGRMLDQLQPA